MQRVAGQSAFGADAVTRQPERAFETPVRQSASVSTTRGRTTRGLSSRVLTPAVLLAAALFAVPASAQTTAADLPPEMQDIGIDDRTGSTVPRDIRLTDHTGRERTFGDYLDDGKPVVLVLAYYQCPMLCTLVLNGIADGLKQLAWTTGESFRTLVVSIDPTETPKLAAEKRANYLEDYGRHVGERGWDFLVAEEDQVRRLADAVGFRYRWDEATSQYAHAAGAFVFTPDGTLSRTFYGITFPERDLRLALTEAGEGRIGGAWERILLFCYSYDPHARGYALAAMRVMKAGGALTVLVLLLGFLWLNRRYRRTDPTGSDDEDSPIHPELELPHAGRTRTQAGGLS